MKRQFIVIHAFFAIISFAFWYYTPSGFGLIWNIFLAIVAFDFSYLACSIKNRWLKPFFMLGWLVFYPNTFYMLTDLVHMSFVTDILNDRLSFMYYIIYMSSILLALILGVLSVRYTLLILRVRHWFWFYLYIIGLSFISSLAIHLGRFARLNSWDVITNPSLVYRELLQIFSYSEVHFVLGFMFIQIMCLLLLIEKMNDFVK
ncbi:DUF1361 domain-containing protein [Streptococcus pluranimalium]|uniref:DUF1361 domain-containing protein n=1 Tax=Streptococcus pluranimalium TaxID=82348 RepID=UPI0039FC3863